MKQGTLVSIRPVKFADLESLQGYLEDVDAKGRFLPTLMHSEAHLAAEFRETGFITESSSRYLVVGEKDRLVGLVWAFKAIPYFDAIEIGYQIFSSEDRGQGFATEAVLLLTDFLFESKQVNRLEIRVAKENKASERIALKAGYAHEGTHREAAFSKGRLYDMHTYALLRREWEERRGGRGRNKKAASVW